MSARRIALPCLGLALLLSVSSAPSGSAESRSAHFRMVSPGPASVAASSESPVYRAYVVGGGGQPVGIAVSANASTVSGGGSAQLPTARIFRNGLESP